MNGHAHLYADTHTGNPAHGQQSFYRPSDDQKGAGAYPGLQHGRHLRSPFSQQQVGDSSMGQAVVTSAELGSMQGLGPGRQHSSRSIGSSDSFGSGGGMAMGEAPPLGMEQAHSRFYTTRAASNLQDEAASIQSQAALVQALLQQHLQQAQQKQQQFVLANPALAASLLQQRMSGLSPQTSVQAGWNAVNAAAPDSRTSSGTFDTPGGVGHMSRLHSMGSAQMHQPGSPAAVAAAYQQQLLQAHQQHQQPPTLSHMSAGQHVSRDRVGSPMHAGMQHMEHTASDTDKSASQGHPSTAGTTPDFNRIYKLSCLARFFASLSI